MPVRQRKLVLRRQEFRTLGWDSYGLRQQWCRYDSGGWYYEGRSSVRWAETAMGWDSSDAGTTVKLVQRQEFRTRGRDTSELRRQLNWYNGRSSVRGAETPVSWDGSGLKWLLADTPRRGRFFKMIWSTSSCLQVHPIRVSKNLTIIQQRTGRRHQNVKPS